MNELEHIKCVFIMFYSNGVIERFFRFPHGNVSSRPVWSLVGTLFVYCFSRDVSGCNTGGLWQRMCEHLKSPESLSAHKAHGRAAQCYSLVGLCIRFVDRCSLLKDQSQCRVTDLTVQHRLPQVVMVSGIILCNCYCSYT